MVYASGGSASLRRYIMSSEEETIVKSGWLLKRSEWLKKWNRRHFVLSLSNSSTGARLRYSVGGDDDEGDLAVGDARRGGWLLDSTCAVTEVSTKKQPMMLKLVARPQPSPREEAEAAALPSGGLPSATTRRAARRAVSAAKRRETIWLRVNDADDFNEWRTLLADCVGSATVVDVPAAASADAAIDAEEEQLRLAIEASLASVAGGGSERGTPLPPPSYGSPPPAATSEDEELRRALALSARASLEEQGAPPSSYPSVGASSAGYGYALQPTPVYSPAASQASTSALPPPAYQPASAYGGVPPSASSYPMAPPTADLPPPYAPPPYEVAVAPRAAAAATGGAVVVDAAAVSVALAPPPYVPSPRASLTAAAWSCAQCTFQTAASAAACGMCGAPRR